MSVLPVRQRNNYYEKRISNSYIGLPGLVVVDDIAHGGVRADWHSVHGVVLRLPESGLYLDRELTVLMLCACADVFGDFASLSFGESREDSRCHLVGVDERSRRHKGVLMVGNE